MVVAPAVAPVVAPAVAPVVEGDVAVPEGEEEEVVVVVEVDEGEAARVVSRAARPAGACARNAAKLSLTNGVSPVSMWSARIAVRR